MSQEDTNKGSEWMLRQIRDSLHERADGHSSGGDIVVMQLVDKIVERESKKKDTRNYHTLENLQHALQTFAIRNRTYGDSYNNFGKLCLALYPDGLPQFRTVAEFNRLGVIMLILSKLSRYVARPEQGHLDSIHDIGVYAFILEELDAKLQDKEVIKSELPAIDPRHCEHIYNINGVACSICGNVKEHAHTHNWVDPELVGIVHCQDCGIDFREWEAATR